MRIFLSPIAKNCLFISGACFDCWSAYQFDVNFLSEFKDVFRDKAE